MIFSGEDGCSVGFVASVSTKEKNNLQNLLSTTIVILTNEKSQDRSSLSVVVFLWVVNCVTSRGYNNNVFSRSPGL